MTADKEDILSNGSVPDDSGLAEVIPDVVPEPEVEKHDHHNHDSEKHKGKRGKKKDASSEEKKKESDEEISILKDKLLRLQADFENFRKRVLREKADVYVRANEDIISELLPVLDHLDIALESVKTHNTPDAFIKGFELVSEQMLFVLKKFGLDQIDSKTHKFDPNMHEAITRLESAEHPEDTILKHVRKGYTLGGKLLRASQVVIAGNSRESAGGSEEGEACCGEQK